MAKHIPTEANEAEICRLYQYGLTVAETAKSAGFAVTTVTRILRRRGVNRRPRGTRRVTPTSLIDDSGLRSFKIEWDKLASATKGSVSESYVRARLTELGFDVWSPISQNHVTDLLVLSGTTVQRIQVKAATYDLRTKCYRVNFTRHRRLGARVDYQAGDVDFFVVHCVGLATLELYVIPALAITKQQRSPRLFPHRQKLLAVTQESFERFRGAFDLLR